MFCVWLPSTVSAQFYGYADENGVYHFTDNLGDIPEDQRQKLNRYNRKPVNQFTSAERDGESLQEATNMENATEVSEDRATAPETPEDIEDIENAPKASEDGEQEKGDEIMEEARHLSVIKRLNKTKASLDEEYAELVKEKQAIVAEKGTAEALAGVEDFNEKADRFNDRIAAFEEKRKAFQKEVDAFYAETEK